MHTCFGWRMWCFGWRISLWDGVLGVWSIWYLGRYIRYFHHKICGDKPCSKHLWLIWLAQFQVETATSMIKHPPKHLQMLGGWVGGWVGFKDVRNLSIALWYCCNDGQWCQPKQQVCQPKYLVRNIDLHTIVENLRTFWHTVYDLVIAIEYKE